MGKVMQEGYNVELIIGYFIPHIWRTWIGFISAHSVVPFRSLCMFIRDM